MYKIYFKNINGEYYSPIIRETDKEIFILANTYWQFVPSLMITDSNDFNIFEVENGNILHLTQEESNSIKKAFKENLIEIPYTEFKVLYKLYQDKQEKLKTVKNNKIANELRELDINLLAISAKENINLANQKYINSEVFIDTINIDDSHNISQYFENLYEDIKENKTLIIMPIGRIVFDGMPIVGPYQFIPPESIDYKELFEIEDSLFNHDLRTLVSSLTGFSIDILHNNYCIAFSYDLNWDEFKLYSHNKDDITLLKLLSSYTDQLFNLIKFNCCKLNLPDTLPGEVGAWTGSNDYSGALLYNEQHGSFLISGSAIESSRVVKGLGLDINDIDFIAEQLYNLENDDEVSVVIKYSLSLFNDAIYSNSSTTKFMKMMTLFEYIAYPHQYEGFQKVKQYIICHSAKSKTEYHNLSNRFITLSKDYRTEIIHNGKILETIIPNFDERQKLFDELQLYFKKALTSMMSFQGQTWEDLINHRKNLIASFS